MVESVDSEFAHFGAGLCASFLQKLPITGISMSASSGFGPETSVFSSDTTSAGIDELQFDLGEGPRWTALQTRQPVLLPDVKLEAPVSWPVFSKAVSEFEVAAIFVFPLRVGAVDVGLIEMYSSTPGSLESADYSLAIQLCEAASWHLLRYILSLGPAEGTQSMEHSESTERVSRRAIHQATGMVLVQTGLSATNALLLLRAHAFSHDQTVHEVSRDVVSKRLDFTQQG